MSKAMIITVGGSKEPILKSIEEHCPSFVVFLASESSNGIKGAEELIPEILNKSKISNYKVVKIKDPQNLLETYKKSLKASKLVLSKFNKDNVIVDYTGGTKPMSAGVVLAAVSEGFAFSYVGGTKRDKGDLGVVVSGREEVFRGNSPWIVYAEKEKEDARKFFNIFQFASCLEMLKVATEKLAAFPKESIEIRKLRLAARGFDAWDKFRHEEAKDYLERAGIDKTKKNLKFLNELLKEKNMFKKELKSKGLDIENVPTQYLILDLFSNAKRRAEEGKYDDAVARLYRTIEMIGQRLLLKKYGIDSSDVDSGKIKDNLASEDFKKYEDKQNKDGKIKIGLIDNYNLLRELNDPFAAIYNKFEKDLRSSLNFRNDSILAHGFASVDKSKFLKFKQIVISFAKENEVIENFDERINQCEFLKL